MPIVLPVIHSLISSWLNKEYISRFWISNLIFWNGTISFNLVRHLFLFCVLLILVWNHKKLFSVIFLWLWSLAYVALLLFPTQKDATIDRWIRLSELQEYIVVMKRVVWCVLSLEDLWDIQLTSRLWQQNTYVEANFDKQAN